MNCFLYLSCNIFFISFSLSSFINRFIRDGKNIMAIPPNKKNNLNIQYVMEEDIQDSE